MPVLWVSAIPTGREGAAIDPTRPRLTARLPYGEAARPLAGGVTIETEVEPASLLDLGEPGTGLPAAVPAASTRGASCSGASPAGPRGPPPAGEREVRAEAPVRAEGWSAPGPLTLSCAQPERTVVGLAEPVWGRYRTTYTLNLAVMGLALLLGAFAVQQARRRAGLEARAAEEARVRELERQLFHAERLTTVGRLAAGIAHEINNPLEGMSNYLTLAKDALSRADVEAASRHVGSVKQGLDRAAGIVRQVLAHADPAKAPRTPVDLNQVLRETEQFVQSRKEFRHVAFALDLADGAPRRPGQPRHARAGGDEPHRERLRGAAGEGGGAGHARAARARTWWRSSPTAARASPRPTASGCSSRSSRPGTRRASASRSVIPSCGSTTASSRSSRGRGAAPSSGCGCRRSRA